MFLLRHALDLIVETSQRFGVHARGQRHRGRPVGCRAVAGGIDRPHVRDE